MTLVKICGLQTIEAAIQATQSGADFLGIIFAKSKRRVDPSKAKEIVEAVRSLIKKQENGSRYQTKNENEWFATQFNRMGQLLQSRKPLIVGVFSNQSASEINDIVDQTGIDIVQLHGEEDNSMCKEIKVPVIRAIHVGMEDTSSTVEKRIQPDFYHFILLDTKVAGLIQQGGSGQSFDWAVASKLQEKGLPFILAGGLTHENVSHAIHSSHPWVVDVSSGVETDGKKDLDKIRLFLEVVKGQPP